MKKFIGFVHEKKGQTGLEFLLIIAGVILVVGVVGYTLKSTINVAGQQVGAGSSQDIAGNDTVTTGTGGTTLTCTGSAVCRCPSGTSGTYPATCPADGADYLCGIPPTGSCSRDVIDDGDIATEDVTAPSRQ